MLFPNLADSGSALFGTGAIRIRSVRLSDQDGNESFSFWHGESFQMTIGYEIRDPSLNENCDIVVAILRGGVETACRIFTRSLRLNYASTRKGEIKVSLGKLMLGVGEYSTSILIAREGYYDQQGHVFYSINPDVHVSVRELVEFSVRATGVLADGANWVAEADWELVPAPDDSDRNVHQAVPSTEEGIR